MCKQEFISESLQEVRLIVGAVGIPARGTASCCNLLSFLLQCRGQELKVSGAKRKANARSSYSLYILLIYNLTAKLQFILQCKTRRIWHIPQ